LKSRHVGVEASFHMLHDLDPSQCLSKTNASLLVGDVSST